MVVMLNLRELGQWKGVFLNGLIPPQVLQIINKIYAGIEDSTVWDEAIRDFVTYSGGYFALVGLIDHRAKDVPFTSLAGPETSRLETANLLHRTELLPIDPGLPYALARPDGGNFRYRQQTEVDGSLPGDWRDFIEGGLGSTDYSARFSGCEQGLQVSLTLHVDQPPGLTRAQQGLHELVFRHFERAMRLRMRPPHIAEHGDPQVIVDAFGRVLRINEKAVRALEVDPALAMRNARLVATTSRDAVMLAGAILAICQPHVSGQSERYLRMTYGDGLILRLTPLPFVIDKTCLARGHCLIDFLTPPARAVPVASDTLIGLFGLTRREAALASRFSGPDNSLRDAAQAVEMGYETARFHMRSILEKCAVANQVELAQLLGRLTRS